MKNDIVLVLCVAATWIAILLLGSRVEQVNLAAKQCLDKQERIERAILDGF